MPFVRKGIKGLIDLYGSSAGDVPPSEALQETIEKVGVGGWVSEAEPQASGLRKQHYLHFSLL